MLKRTLTHTLVILFVLCCTNALAAKWTVNFEKNLREGNIQKAVQEALNNNVSQADILTALEKALEKGVVPEGKTIEVEEFLIAEAAGCVELCTQSSAIIKKECANDTWQKTCECCP